MRLCECGCGEVIRGSPRKRFVSDAHRKRSARARNGHEPDADALIVDPDTNPDTNPDTDPDGTRTPQRPDTEPGRCREGLEEWLRDHWDLPSALVEHCRTLADEVDADPTRSPIHGRYTSALAALIEAASRWSPEDESEWAELQFKIRTSCDVPEHYSGALGKKVHCAKCCAEGRLSEQR